MKPIRSIPSVQGFVYSQKKCHRLWLRFWNDIESVHYEYVGAKIKQAMMEEINEIN